MSGPTTPLADGLLPSASHRLPRGPGMVLETHGRVDPDSPWCKCGHLREACVSDEVRTLWADLLHPTGQ
ncbi:hypothetical protein Aab01nite_19730 [Paractinoplanes abujensis]|uniref:Uncharacterized protein n=1 Tax=Paractinoplanes abujensis TaxID=882441 RepID=A0A7W7D1C5_9ACTN|nr:hypothetical protein [Actinoplanes abujensis]GID18383.1 hypothetical protein Aab01nite_19730 [Actinoplanes abujensis]